MNIREVIDGTIEFNNAVNLAKVKIQEAIANTPEFRNFTENARFAVLSEAMDELLADYQERQNAREFDEDE